MIPYNDLVADVKKGDSNKSSTLGVVLQGVKFGKLNYHKSLLIYTLQ